jgi:Fe-S cluster biogenesis protein NfuA
VTHLSAGSEVTPKTDLRHAVESRIGRISQVLGSHAGGVTLDKLGEGGDVVLRFTGMCVGCHLKPVTMMSLVIPALLDIEGVTSVEAPGAAASLESQERLRSYLSRYSSSLLLDRLKQ